MGGKIENDRKEREEERTRERERKHRCAYRVGRMEIRERVFLIKRDTDRQGSEQK